MKIKAEVNLDILSNYGFVEVSSLEEWDNPLTENGQLDFLGFADYSWFYKIGHSRRGQYYYLLVTYKDRELVVAASKPDGSGGTVSLPFILKQMILDGIVD